MSEPKWTPGPWAHNVEGLNPHVVVAPASGRIVARADFSGNRALIAAAPDLYAALEEAIECAQFPEDIETIIHAALAKARGEMT